MSQDLPVVINLGGSILMPQEPSAAYLLQVAKSLWELAQNIGPLYVVVGGGHTARRYIQLAREAGQNGQKELTEAQLDDLGIDATRLNARLLLGAMQTQGAIVPWEVPEDLHRATTLAQHYDCVVMGGTVPGHTTDAVSAMLARQVGAGKLVIATNVDGVYTADPRTHPGAELVERLDFARLIDIVGEPTGEAGVAAVVDPTAARVAAGIGGLELAVVKGIDLDNLKAACLGERFEGSLVKG